MMPGDIRWTVKSNKAGRVLADSCGYISRLLPLPNQMDSRNCALCTIRVSKPRAHRKYRRLPFGFVPTAATK